MDDQEVINYLLARYPTAADLQVWLAAVYSRYRQLAQQKRATQATKRRAERLASKQLAEQKFAAQAADRRAERLADKLRYAAMAERNRLIEWEAALAPRCRFHHNGLPMTSAQWDRLRIGDHYWFINEDGTWQLREVEKLGRGKNHHAVRNTPPRTCPFGADPWPGYTTQHHWPEK